MPNIGSRFSSPHELHVLCGIDAMENYKLRHQPTNIGDKSPDLSFDLAMRGLREVPPEVDARLTRDAWVDDPKFHPGQASSYI